LRIALVAELIRERNFNPKQVESFLGDFRAMARADGGESDRTRRTTHNLKGGDHIESNFDHALSDQPVAIHERAAENFSGSFCFSMNPN
jgi:hypothetical protein